MSELISGEIVTHAIDQKRRSVLLGVGGLGISQVLGQSLSEAQAAAPAQAAEAIQSEALQGYVLGASEGEHLVHFRDHGEIFIKIGASTGSGNLALGTQQVTVGAGIPIHRHFHADEAFYVLEGGGVFILNDVRHSFEKGATIFIPKNSWHGFVNPDRELLLLWIMTPGGLDGFFRETCSPPGVPPKQLTQEQIREIAHKYGTEFR